MTIAVELGHKATKQTNTWSYISPRCDIMHKLVFTILQLLSLLQGAQEDADADGRLPKQDERYTVYESYQRNTTGQYDITVKPGFIKYLTYADSCWN